MCHFFSIEFMYIDKFTEQWKTWCKDVSIDYKILVIEGILDIILQIRNFKDRTQSIWLSGLFIAVHGLKNTMGGHGQGEQRQKKTECQCYKMVKN